MKAALTLCLVLSVALAGHAQELSFPKTAVVLPTGKEADVIVRFGDQAVSLVCDDDLCGAKGKELQAFLYRDITELQYSFSKAPRWKSGLGVAAAAPIVALPMFFMKGKKHWLTIQGGSDFASLHLDKKNYRPILAALEARTGRRVEVATDAEK